LQLAVTAAANATGLAAILTGMEMTPVPQITAARLSLPVGEASGSA
jgi:hypothetical protein